MLGQQLSSGPSPRVALGRLALGAALGLPGVAGADQGPAAGASVSGPDGRPLPGVSAIGAAGGRYDIELRLVAALPLVATLPLLAEQVRGAVEAAARVAGLSQSLGEIDVAFVDVAFVDLALGGPR